MGYYIWRRGSWQRVDPETGTLEDGTRASFLYVRGGELRVAPRREVLRRMRTHTLRRAAELPSRALHDRRRCSGCHPPQPVPVCCHHAAAPQPLYSCQHQHQQWTTLPNKTEQTVQPQQQINQQQPQQHNNQLQTQQHDNQHENGSDSSSQESPCKELILDYADVNRIQTYLDKHPGVIGTVDPKLFQEDELYRSAVLFRFQPLVKIERLDPIEKYYSKKLNLKEFAANLGLKHIEDIKSERRTYRTRNNIDKNFSKYFGKQFLDQSTDKENYVNNSMEESESDIDSKSSSSEADHGRRVTQREIDNLLNDHGRRVTQREIDNLLNEPKHLRSNVSELKISPVRVREKDDNRAKAPVSRKRKRDDDDSDTTNVEKEDGDSGKVGANKTNDNKKPGRFFTKKDRSNFIRSGRVAKPVSFKSGSGREYSSLEDHAIVAWVHNGRSRLVNGNRVWRHLQDSYTNITGLNRSWQSLRNRYLRHILPSLSALRLARGVSETLRAHAAMGELKLPRKKSSSRRNSIFKQHQVESAWSRQNRTQGRRLAAGPPDQTVGTTTTAPSRVTVDKDEVTAEVSRARRTRPNVDKHSSESDEFQPKPTRLNSNERRNNDIRRLAHRMMRSPRLANKANVSQTTENVSKLNKSVSNVNENVEQTSKTVTNTNKPSHLSAKVPVSTQNVVKSDDKSTNSVIKTRNSMSNQTKAVTSSLRSSSSSVKEFNTNNLRSPRTLGGNLCQSPTKRGAGSSGKPRLSADQQMARDGARAHKRPLYNHRAVPI